VNTEIHWSRRSYTQWLAVMSIGIHARALLAAPSGPDRQCASTPAPDWAPYIFCTAWEIDPLAGVASTKMRISRVEHGSGNALRHDATLVGPHHIFQQEGKPALHRDVVGLELVEAANIPHEFALIVDRVRE